MTAVTVIPRPAISPARVEILWDADVQNLYCTIEYPERDRSKHESTALRDMLDAQWPLPQPRRMIFGGHLSMGLDAEERLSNLDILTNATDWILHPLAPVSADFMQPYIQVAFEEHGDAECAPIEEVLYDADQGIFCLSWGEAQRWCNVAPTLALGLAADGSLMKIQLSDFRFSEPKCRAESAWERLKRKLRPPAGRFRAARGTFRSSREARHAADAASPP
ncbi:hypothetical protein [Achromobacter sp.]|uniref:hypothetical protein n=1 Tax=Achromobacter sp. TaxID=134375 RepID=UPI003C72C09D